MDTFIELNCDLCHFKLTPYGSKVLKDGIICLQEKNIIIDMINEFRKSI